MNKWWIYDIYRDFIIPFHLTETLRLSMRSAGISNAAVVESVVTDAGAESRLAPAFTEHVRDNIRKDISKNPDAKKFPDIGKKI